MTNLFTAKKINVPGLLSDEALQEQLKQFGDQAKAQVQAAPPPTAAFDFADRVTEQYLSQPAPTMRAPAAPPGGATRSGVMSGLKTLNSTASWMTPTGIAGNIAPRLFEEIGRLGTLTAEESRAEQAANDAELKAREAAFQNKADVRTRLREMTSEQAAEMGLPVPPGGTPPVEYRPLRDGEQRVNDDGTVSTEVTLSPMLPDGTFATVPSLWMTQDGVVELDEDQALQRALEYEQLTGVKFPRAATADEANKTAKERSEAGGANVGPLAQSAAVKTIREKIALNDKIAPTQAWWLNMLQVGARSAALTGTSSLKYPLIWWEQAEAAMTGTMEKSAPREWLQSIDKEVTKILPGDPARAKDFLTDIAAGGGSFAAFMVAGYVSVAAGIPAGVGAGVLGATVGGSNLFEEAEQFDATATQKFLSLLIGSGLGATEAFPIDRMFMRADAASGGAIRRLLTTTAAGSLEEFIQEAGQTLGEDLAAKYLFDDDREISAAKILRQGLIGALTGAAGSVVTQGVAEIGVAPRIEAEMPVAERERMAQGVIDVLQREVDTITTAPLPEVADIVGADGQVIAAGPQDVITLPDGTEAMVERAPAIETPEFKNWFGDSKVVDDTGTPLVVYHGTNADFTAFDKSKSTFGYHGGGFYFTPDQEWASSFGKTKEVYLSMLNPFNKDTMGITPAMVAEYVSVMKERGATDDWIEAKVDNTIHSGDFDIGLGDLGEITPMEIQRVYKAGGFDGVVAENGNVMVVFDPTQIKSVNNRGTFDPADPDILSMTAPERQRQLIDEVPGFKGVAKYLTPEERPAFRKSSAKKLVEIFEQMPDPKEMAAVAISGRAKRGWYARSAKALVDTFGIEDAPRFAALLAALSPQVSVESNAINALSVWGAWVRAGRPTDRAAIVRIMGGAVQGSKGADSVLPAWVDNSVRALTTPDATTARLSGPKVDSFMKNLQGITVEVTNDAWMANYANVEQALFRGTYRKDETGSKVGEKGVGYIAMAAAVRRAADAATKLTGQQWTPAEIQETVWSWAKTLYEKRDAAGENRTTVEILNAGGLTAEEIASTPDFASLFAGGVYRNLLEKAGYNVETDGSSGSGAGSDGGRGDVRSAEGTGFAQDAFERHLRRAARRLEDLRNQRLDAEGRRADEKPVTTDFPGGAPSDPGAGSLQLEDTFDGIDFMVVGDKELARLPGLPSNSSGPVASVVQAARAYAKSIGIPFRRQATYVKADPERGRRIAEAYDRMKHAPEDPVVKAAYQAMIDETLAQFQFVKASGLDIDFIPEGAADPYPGGPREVLDDLQRGHLWVFPTDQGFGSLSEAEQSNPLLAETDEVVKGRKLLANDVFRIVHDFFGHGLEGAGFGARGEENAWQAHMRLFTEAALPAVTSETRGQNSWVNFGPYGESNRANQRETVYADQKTGVMPPWTWREGVDDDSSVAFGDGVVTAEEFKAADAPTQDMLARPGWAILTGTQEALGAWDAPENVASNDQLRTELAGTDAIEITGSYEGVAQGPSWIVFSPPAEALAIAKRYGQESILTNEGLDYGDGTIVPADPLMTTVGDEARQQPFFSALPNGNAFSMGLDFETGRVPRSEAIFAGAKAATGNVDALETAMRMVKEGRQMEDIWEATGFFYGRDGQWRFEISDRDADFTPAALQSLTPPPTAGKFWTGIAFGSLGEMVKHDKLFAAYPELRKVEVKLRTAPGAQNQSGQFYKDNAGTLHIEATGRDLEDLLSVTLHEAQHAVQTEENFARGGNMSLGELYEGPDVAAWMTALGEANEAFKAFRDAGGDQRGRRARLTKLENDVREAELNLRRAAAYEYYRRISGEVEARNVQARADLARSGKRQSDAGERVAPISMPFPDATADVASEDQIVIMRTTGQSMAPVMMAQNNSTSNAGPFGTASNRTVFRAEQTRPTGGVPATGPVTEDTSLARISANFIKLMGITARQGRLTIRGADVMGQYSRRSDVVRLRAQNDLSTLAHEGGHALHDARSTLLDGFVQQNSRTFMAVGTKLYGGDLTYANKETHEREGFAEFFRVYVLNKRYLRRNYPALLDDFETLMDQNAPELKRGLELVSQQHEAWLQLPSVAELRNTIVPAIQPSGMNAAIAELREVGFNTWFSEMSRKAVSESVNRYAALNKVVGEMLNIGERNAGRAIDLKVADDPRALIRLARNSGSRAMLELTDGVYGYRSLQPTTRGLRDALMISQGLTVDDSPRALNEQRLADFDTYLVALRALDEYRRKDEGKIAKMPIRQHLGDVSQAIIDLEAQYGASFTQAAAIVHEYGMALWQKAYDAGLMSKTTYKAGLDRQFYVPLQRDMSDRSNATMGPTSISGGRSIVKRFQGSDRDIVSPISVLMHKTFALENIIAQNDVMKTLAALADRAGRTGALVERIPASKLVAKSLSIEEIARQITKDDTITEADAHDLLEILGDMIDQNKLITTFRAEQASTRNENVLFFWENGSVAAIQLADNDLGADVVNMMNSLGPENMHTALEIVALMSSAFRSAITAWPDFLIVNFIRDQLSAWILTDVGFKPFVTGIKGVGDELRQSKWAKQYNAAGGIMGGMTVATLHEARVRKDIDALRSKGYLARAFAGKGFSGAVAGMGRVVEMTETGTRLGIFRKAFERAKADGLTEYEAGLEAAYTATDYIDFGLNGTRMLAARRTIPFLNAQLQGLYKMLRTLGADEVRQRKGLMFALKAFFKDTRQLSLSRAERNAVVTGRKAWLKMTSIGLIGAALHFLFEDDPDYQEAGEYLRTTGWVIPMGDGRLFYIPKPFELAMVSNVMERALEFASGDPQAKSRFLRGFAMTMVPPTSPPAVQVVVEYAANKNFFSGQEIVPSYMQALDPILQYNNYTSEFAKSIGEITGWSPMVVDHFMSGLGASAYRDMVTMTNALNPARPSMDETDAPILRRFIRDTRRGSASARDFWELASMQTGRMRTAEVTYKALADAGNTVAANRFLADLPADQRAYALLNVHFEAKYKRLNPFYRGRQITTVISAMRREIGSDLGLEDTSPFGDGTIVMTAREKAEVDEVLSEYARREIRNTLVATRTGGWDNKAVMPTQPTLDLLDQIDPRVAIELAARVEKANIYSAEAVFEYWPEVQDRLLLDREAAFLDDILAIAKVMQ